MANPIPTPTPMIEDAAQAHPPPANPPRQMKSPAIPLRPARSIGQTRRENAAARRVAKGLPPKTVPPSRMKSCDECEMPISATEHAYNGGLCSTCCINN